MNFAAQQARGKFWLTIDSDDTILPDALLKYYKAWNSIPENERNEYCGVSARCIDSEGNIVGDKLPYQPAANYFLWLYLVNNLTQYFFSYPIKIVKAYVGVSMDGFVSGRNINGILKDIHGWKKIPALMLMGVDGYWQRNKNVKMILVL